MRISRWIKPLLIFFQFSKKIIFFGNFLVKMVPLKNGINLREYNFSRLQVVSNKVKLFTDLFSKSCDLELRLGFIFSYKYCWMFNCVLFLYFKMVTSLNFTKAFVILFKQKHISSWSPLVFYENYISQSAPFKSECMHFT